jgi:hypothetical protein
MQRRLAVSALLSLLAVLLGLVSMPGSASADDGNITVLSAGPTNGNPALLTVDIDDLNAGGYISGQTVDLTNTVTSNEVTIPDTAWTYPTSGSTTDQAVIMTSPIAEGTGAGQLPPGTYSLSVDATDSTGDSGSGLPAGTLAFAWTDTTLSASSTAISYASQTSTISGALTGVAPGDTTSSQAGIGEEAVSLINQSTSASQPIATTASDGSYSGTAQLNPADSYIVQVETDAAHGVPTSTSTAFTAKANADTTRLLSVAVKPEDLAYGKTGMMTGTAQYQNGATWTGLSNSSVQVTIGHAKPVTVATGANGQFVYTVPSNEGTSWSVTVAGTPLLASSLAAGTIHVAVPIAVRSYRATLGTFGVIITSGCVQVTVPDFSPPGRSGRIEIQYAAARAGPWKNLGSLPIGSATSSSCKAGNESYFTGSLAARLPSAYYRAEYPGDINFEHTVSSVARAWKYVTDVTSVRVSPRSVGHGGKITVSGRLRQYVRSWENFGKQQILIILKPRGKKSWYWIYKVTTSSRGQFSKKFVDPTTASWSAEYLGNKTHLASVGAAFSVTVRGKAMLSPAQLRLLARGPDYPAGPEA